ncbi:MAG: hypothetical protein ACTSU2_05575 [Promethearchaeota archaeon]
MENISDNIQIQEDEKNIYIVKKKVRYNVLCPICKKKQDVGIELGLLKEVKQFPFAHIFIHGDPVHVLIVYIDKDLNIRGFEGCTSLEIKKEGNTFTNLLKKWSNPF